MKQMGEDPWGDIKVVIQGVEPKLRLPILPITVVLLNLKMVLRSGSRI